jgi:hypothetical protein
MIEKSGVQTGVNWKDTPVESNFPTLLPERYGFAGRVISKRDASFEIKLVVGIGEKG